MVRNFFFLSLFLCVCLSQALVGVDLSARVTTAGWAEIIASTAPGPVSFASVHALSFNGSLNYDAPATIISAWDSGIRNISLYMFSCVQSSTYAQPTPTDPTVIDCGTAKDHIDKIVHLMTINDIGFISHSTQFSPVPSFEPSVPSDLTEDPTMAPTALPTKSPSSSFAAYIERLYVIVEDESPSRYYDTNPTVNSQFLQDLVKNAHDYGIAMGIYTTKKDWFNIMVPPELWPPSPVVSYKLTTVSASASTSAAASTTRSNITWPFSGLPLWTPRYDQVYNMAFFVPFAGWEYAYIKQTSCGSTLERRVGHSRICTDYIDEANSNFTATFNQEIVLPYIYS